MRLARNAKVDLIKTVPLFTHLSKKQLAEVAHVADEIDLPAGKTLTREGERGREFLILLDGTAEVTKDGQRIREIGPGDFLGEIALLVNVPRTATVTTTTPVRALVVTERDFRGVIGRSPETQAKLVEALAERLAATTL